MSSAGWFAYWSIWNYMDGVFINYFWLWATSAGCVGFLSGMLTPPPLPRVVSALLSHESHSGADQLCLEAWTFVKSIKTASGQKLTNYQKAQIQTFWPRTYAGALDDGGKALYTCRCALIVQIIHRSGREASDATAFLGRQRHVWYSDMCTYFSASLLSCGSSDLYPA